MDVLAWVFMILLTALGFGYLLGKAANRQRARDILLQIQQELHPYGTLSQPEPANPQQTGFRLVPSAGGIQYLDFTLHLEAREFLPLWLWQRLHGVRDQLFIRGNSSPVPNFDVRIFPLADLQSLHALQASGKPFKLLQEANEFGIYVRGVGAPSSRDTLPNFIVNFSGALVWLAIQSPAYNVELRLKLDRLNRHSYAILYQSLQAIVR